MIGGVPQEQVPYHAGRVRPVRKVIVLGGGLAGLVCAKALARAGVPVEVWESSDQFGGKAGSRRGPGGRWVDHGFHIFPEWYANTNHLLDVLGIDLWRSKDFYEVWPNEPHGRPIKQRRFDRTMVASLDLISRSSSYLSDLSLHGFLRGRIYTGENSANRLREISRKALGSPAYLSSAETMQRNLQWWLPCSASRTGTRSGVRCRPRSSSRWYGPPRPPVRRCISVAP